MYTVLDYCIKQLISDVKKTNKWFEKSFLKTVLIFVALHKCGRSVRNPWRLLCSDFIPTRFRPIKGRQDELKDIIESFKKHDDLEKAFEALTCGDSSRNHLLSKTKAQEKLFKQHVCLFKACFFTCGDGDDVENANVTRGVLFLSYFLRCLFICACLRVTAGSRFCLATDIHLSKMEPK